jgi:hypothetical protein
MTSFLILFTPRYDPRRAGGLRESESHSGFGRHPQRTGPRRAGIEAPPGRLEFGRLGDA